MKKKNKIVMILIIVLLILIFGLYFIIKITEKDSKQVITNESVSSESKEEEIIPSESEEIVEKNEIIKEEEITNSTINNSSSSSNSSGNDESVNSNTTNNNTSTNSNTTVVESKSEIVESTFTQKVLSTSEGINLKYWLYTPKNPKDNMPLIVYLHGGSGKGSDLNKVVEGSLPKFIKNGELGNINAYIIMPQVPSNYKGWSDIKVSVKDLINNVKSAYKINQNKISLTGHSMGGKGTYDIALSYPTLFSCIAPMSGSVTVNDTNINKLKNVPIWAFVGSSDTIVDPSTSTAFLTEIKQYNSSSKLTTFDGATHFDVPELGYKSTDVINWLISNSK